MAIAFRQSVSTTNSPTALLPSAPLAGNLLWAVVISEAVATAITAPAGWALIRSSLASATQFAMAMFAKIAVAADQSSTFSVVGGSTVYVAVHEYSGAGAVPTLSAIQNAAGGAHLAGGDLPAMGTPAIGLLIGVGASNQGFLQAPRFYTQREDVASHLHTCDRLVLPLPTQVAADPGVEILPTAGQPNGTHISPTITVPANTVVTLDFDQSGVPAAYFCNISFDADAGVNNLVNAAGHWTFTRTTPNDGSSHQVYAFITAQGGPTATISRGTLTAPGATGFVYNASQGWYAGDLTGGLVWTMAQVLMPLGVQSAFVGEPGGGIW